MSSGIITSITLETFLLRFGEKMKWKIAFETAVGMSLISMLMMEFVENSLDYYLTGGIVNLKSMSFWTSAGLSMGAGFLVALPYNYYKLRRFGKSCH